MSTLRHRDLLLSMKYSTIEACFSVPMLNLTMPNLPFAVAFATSVLGWTPGALVLMAALPHLFNCIQPPLTMWFQGRAPLFRLMAWGFALSAVPWLCLIFFREANFALNSAFVTVL